MGVLRRKRLFITMLSRSVDVQQIQLLTTIRTNKQKISNSYANNSRKIYNTLFSESSRALNYVFFFLLKGF